MAEILALADARLALRTTPSDTTNDADLSGTYIPATTALVEGIIGPVMARTGVTQVFDGGSSDLLLPSAVTAVTAVTVTGVPLAASGYVVDLTAGVVHGSYGTRFAPGIQNVVVTFNVGTAATTANVPSAIKLAARIILAHLWQVDQQGFRPQFNGPDMGTMPIGIGYAIPNRAAELLAPYVVDVGFA